MRTLGFYAAKGKDRVGQSTFLNGKLLCLEKVRQSEVGLFGPRSMEHVEIAVI